MWIEMLPELKKASGKTTKEISEASGVPIGTLNKLFAGQTKDPKLDTITAVVHALGYTLGDLVQKKDPLKQQMLNREILTRFLLKNQIGF